MNYVIDVYIHVIYSNTQCTVYIKRKIILKQNFKISLLCRHSKRRGRFAPVCALKFLAGSIAEESKSADASQAVCVCCTCSASIHGRIWRPSTGIALVLARAAALVRGKTALYRTAVARVRGHRVALACAGRIGTRPISSCGFAGRSHLASLCAVSACRRHALEGISLVAHSHVFAR